MKTVLNLAEVTLSSRDGSSNEDEILTEYILPWLNVLEFKQETYSYSRPVPIKKQITF
mgnify:CR=1 FL=1